MSLQLLSELSCGCHEFVTDPASLFQDSDYLMHWIVIIFADRLNLLYDMLWQFSANIGENSIVQHMRMSCQVMEAESGHGR